MKHDSEQEFSRLYNMHVQELFNYGMHVCDDPEFVKRCLQKLFVRVWEQHPSLGVVASIKSYLFGSFRQLLIENIFSRKSPARVTNFSRPQFEVEELTDDVFFDYGVSPFNNEQIIQGLTERQSEAVFLKFCNRFSYHEVATIMDLNVAAVYSLVSGAVEIFGQRMEKSVIMERP